MRIRSQPMFYTGIFLLLSVIILNTVKIHTGLYINVTASERLGIYREIPLTMPLQLQHGDLIVIRVPTSVEETVISRGWMPKNQNMLKSVYALPGETYCITDSEITVMEKYVGPVYEKDHEGLPLPKLRGTFIVKAAHILPIASRKPNSFDGRYFGDVPMDLIVAKVVPLLIIPEGIL